MKRMLKPETDYEAPNKTTIAYLTMCWETGRAITGVPIDYDINEKVIIVDLGNGYYGQLPFDECVIEKLKYCNDATIPLQVRMIVQKRVIRIKITRIENDKIVLSRKKNLLEICEYFLEENKLKVEAIVAETTEFGVFCDIGEGLIALCHYSEMSRARINPKSFLKVGTRVNVIVFPNSKEENMLNCSIRKATVVDYSKIKSGTIINVKVGLPLFDENGKVTGYFVEITPSISGIADINPYYERNTKLKSGDIVKAYVRSVQPSKHKVKLTIK